jgi:hypothetical protein
MSGACLARCLQPASRRYLARGLGNHRLAASGHGYRGKLDLQSEEALQSPALALTEATIESGAMEAVAHARYGDVTLPVFAFSYVVDREYYSGRFALFPYITDPGESIFARMAGRKLQLHYDPRKPAEWFLPEELIEGCEVEQEIGPHWNNYYPK